MVAEFERSVKIDDDSIEAMFTNENELSSVLDRFKQ
jgi:hypothetical protein